MTLSASVPNGEKIDLTPAMRCVLSVRVGVLGSVEHDERVAVP
jgi:hypothetical protein